MAASRLRGPAASIPVARSALGCCGSIAGDDTRLPAVCGRFTQERASSEFAEIFGAEDLAGLDAGRYNVAPTDAAAVVVARDGRRAVTAYRWGLVPHWASSARVGSRMFNARAETLTASPAFRDAFRRRRCLVPVDSFYEWQGDGGARRPLRIGRRDGLPLALAGLWSGWRDPDDGTVRRTFTIVTTTPNELIAPIHDRMPVILPAGAWADWLDMATPDPSRLLGLLVPNRTDDLVAVPVSRLVNDVRNDGPALIEPAGD